MNPQMRGVLVSLEWNDKLMDEIQDLRAWLLSPANADEILEELTDVLFDKHHDYGEENLVAFGELGVLVRASDKLARLKNLIEKPAQVKDESRADTWRDLAGYALQALILMKRARPRADRFEIRRNRLIRGLCPDCGKGALLRRQQWQRLQVELFCSERCGFVTPVDIFELDTDTTEVIHRLAGREAVVEQAL